MLVKLATLTVKQELPKGTIEDQSQIVHIPRPVQEQIGRKKNPVRIINAY